MAFTAFIWAEARFSYYFYPLTEVNCKGYILRLLFGLILFPCQVYRTY